MTMIDETLYEQHFHCALTNMTFFYNDPINNLSAWPAAAGNKTLPKPMSSKMPDAMLHH